MWINFSISENEMERIRNNVKAGTLRLPENRAFIVEIELVDGSIFPYKGAITFTDPSYNPQTGTFLIRASVDNPDGVLRPESIRAHATRRRRPAERDSRPAARGATGRKGTFRLGREQGRQGRAEAGGGRRLVRRFVVHLAGVFGRRPSRRRRRLAARTRRVRQGHAVRTEARRARSGSDVRAAPARRSSSISRSGRATLDAEALRLLKASHPR
jgi:hypothetical protein